MIIKYYTTDASLIIIDGVGDVSVLTNPDDNDNYSVYDFDEEPEVQYSPPKYIDFAKDGPCRLRVNNVAYICNDEGKTIEKVSA